MPRCIEYRIPICIDLRAMSSESNAGKGESSARDRIEQDVAPMVTWWHVGEQQTWSWLLDHLIVVYYYLLLCVCHLSSVISSNIRSVISHQWNEWNHTRYQSSVCTWNYIIKCPRGACGRAAVPIVFVFVLVLVLVDLLPEPGSVFSSCDYCSGPVHRSCEHLLPGCLACFFCFVDCCLL